MDWPWRRDRRRTRPVPPDLGASTPARRRTVGPGLIASGLFALRALVVLAVLVALAPAAVGWRPMVIIGGSMEPVIHRGDVVVVDPKAQVDDGDVITFADPDRGVITHRVRWREPDGRIRTRGDANHADDPLLDPTNVIGKSRLVVPMVGLPVSWATNGQVTSAVAALLLALLLVVDPAGRRLAARGWRGGRLVAAEHVAGWGLGVGYGLAAVVTATL